MFKFSVTFLSIRSFVELTFFRNELLSLILLTFSIPHNDLYNLPLVSVALTTVLTTLPSDVAMFLPDFRKVVDTQFNLVLFLLNQIEVKLRTILVTTILGGGNILPLAYHYHLSFLHFLLYRSIIILQHVQIIGHLHIISSLLTLNSL